MGLQLNPMGGTGGLNFGLGAPDPMSLIASIGSFGADGSTPANVAMPGQTGPMNASLAAVRPQPRPTDLAGGAAAGSTDPAAQGWFDKIGGINGLGTIASGLGDLGKLWGAIQGVKLAREQLNFNKESYATNLANQTQSYNTTLEDRTRQRFAFEGKNASQADTYLKAHSL